MNELSLFTGAGGGLLGSILLNWKTIGYVENNKYCQKIITQRIKDGILDKAPVFGDIRTFVSEGYAEAYKGMVDVITAGFPCQPFSVAGKGEGGEDPRNMWPATNECIRIIRPRYALLENVPGLLTHKYIRRIFGDLAESGYDAGWCVLGASDIGANHRRNRLWILADSKGGGTGRLRNKSKKEGSQNSNELSGISGGIQGETNHIPDPDCSGCRERWKPESIQEKYHTSKCIGKNVADTKGIPERSRLCEDKETQIGWERSGDFSSKVECDWWLSEPDMGRVAHGVANRVDRLKAIGNGQVPAVVKAVWEALI